MNLKPTGASPSGWTRPAFFSVCQKGSSFFGCFRNDLPYPITLFPLYHRPQSESFPNSFSLAVN